MLDASINLNSTQNGASLMENYQSSASRLARVFKKSRDAWKEKALLRQRKIKALQTKVRDLTHSRNEWKKRAKEAERELQRLKKSKKKSSDNDAKSPHKFNVSSKEPTALERPAGHLYPVFMIQLAIQQIIEGLCSLRGCQKNFSLFSQFFAVPTPAFNTVRNWLFRLGLYELKKKHELRDDWIIILDLTVELGQAKCLVILGIPAARLSKTGYCLQHQDVEVLDVTVLYSSTGEVIAKKLADLSTKIGTPLQILADHGSDLKKGIELYQSKNPKVIYTYDVTHQMALLLKHELGQDERFQSFLHQCSRTRLQTQQTSLYFLVPPKQRLKSRYLNLDTHVRWAQQILAYQERGDFSQISTDLMIDDKTLTSLAECLDSETLTKLARIKGQVFDNARSFTVAVTQHIGKLAFYQNQESICQSACVGRKRFNQKLGWLVDYQSDIKLYAQLINLVNLAQEQVKQKGLNHKSKIIFVENTKEMIIINRALKLKKKIEVYFSKESEKIPHSQTLLGTSDIIESIFGKYKIFSEARPLKEMGKMLLIIPLLTACINSDLIKKAMEEVKTKDVEEWAEKRFGQSMLSKRRVIFVSRTQK